MNKLFTIIATALLLIGSAVTSGAQAPSAWDPGRPQLTRAELNDLLSRLGEITRSSTYNAQIRDQARDEAVMVRARLEMGDMQVGDQISMVVEGEEGLSQTFAVRPGQMLTLPGIGDIPLRGVLRSELESHLTTELSKYIREPVVHAESLVRVTITGQVGRPGFYGVRAERLLSDAIMEAGGPSAGADLTSIYVERAGERIWSGAYLQQALADGRTLDHLSLQAGDQIVVPGQRQGIGSRMVGVTTGVLSAVAILITIFR